VVTTEIDWPPDDAEPTPTAMDRAFGRSQRPVRNDSDFVFRVMEFANGETDTRPMATVTRQMLGMASGWKPPCLPNGEIDEDLAEDQLSELVDQSDVEFLISGLRDNTKKVLHAAATNPDRLLEWLNKWRARHGSAIGIVRRPEMAVDGRGRLKILWQLDIDNWSPGADFNKALAYVAALLLGDQDGCRSNLGFCHLPECGKYFVVERGRPGKPRRDYCSTKHMKTAHERDSARRHRESRERKKAEAAMGRRRRSK